MNLSANRITKLDQLLTIDWITRRVTTEHVGCAPLNFDFSDNPIDCTEQTANVEAQRNYTINVIVDCP